MYACTRAVHHLCVLQQCGEGASHPGSLHTSKQASTPCTQHTPPSLLPSPPPPAAQGVRRQMPFEVSTADVQALLFSSFIHILHTINVHRGTREKRLSIFLSTEGCHQSKTICTGDLNRSLLKSANMHAISITLDVHYVQREKQSHRLIGRPASLAASRRPASSAETRWPSPC